MKQWSIEIGGSVYEISVNMSKKSKQNVLHINKKPQVLPPTTFWKPDLDYCFYIEGHKLNLVTFDGKCDLAFDGVYQTSGRRYKERKVALWGWILIAIQIVIFAAIAVFPIILTQSISVWIILAIPLTIFTIFGTYRHSSDSMLPRSQHIVRPVLCTVLMIIMLILIIGCY